MKSLDPTTSVLTSFLPPLCNIDGNYCTLKNVVAGHVGIYLCSQHLGSRDGRIGNSMSSLTI